MDYSIPQIPQIPQVPQIPQIPKIPYIPSVPNIPNIGDLGSFNNAVNNFVAENTYSTLQQTDYNPFNDPNRYRSLADVLFSRKLYDRDQNTTNFLEDVGDWVSDNIIGNIPLIGGFLEDVLDGSVEAVRDVYDEIKEIPFVGDVVGLPEHLIKYAVNLPERLLGYVNNVYIEPWQWGGPKLAVMSILNAVGKDADYITLANVVKSIVIPTATYIVTGGKEGNLDILGNIGKGLGLNTETGLVHYEWNTGWLKPKDIPILGWLTQGLVDITSVIKDVPILGLLYDASTMINEISLVDFLLEVVSSPDAWVSFGATEAIESLVKKVAKVSIGNIGTLGDIARTLNNATDTLKGSILKHLDQKAFIQNIKKLGPVEAFTDYYHGLIEKNINNDIFLKELTDEDMLKYIKIMRTHLPESSEYIDASDALKNLLRKEYSNLFNDAATLSKYGIKDAFEIAERWRSVANKMDKLQSLARYNNPITYLKRPAKALYNNIVSKYNEIKVRRAKSIPKNGYYYDDVIFKKEDMDVLNKHIEQSMSSYKQVLPREFRDIDMATYRTMYQEAIDKVAKSTDYQQGLLDDNAIHLLITKEFIARMEELAGKKIDDSVKNLLYEIYIKEFDIPASQKVPKRFSKAARDFYKFIENVKTINEAVNDSLKITESKIIEKYWNDTINDLARLPNNFRRLKEFYTTDYSAPNRGMLLSEYKKFFRTTPYQDTTNESIKGFQKLLDHMHVYTKDLKQIEKLFALDDNLVDYIEKVFNDTELTDNQKINALVETLGKDNLIRYTDGRVKINKYKNLFKNSKMKRAYTLEEKFKYLFGDDNPYIEDTNSVLQEVKIDLREHEVEALDTYGLSKRTKRRVKQVYRKGSSIYAEYDPNDRLNGARIMAGLENKRIDATVQLTKSIEGLIVSKDYFEDGWRIRDSLLSKYGSMKEVYPEIDRLYKERVNTILNDMKNVAEAIELYADSQNYETPSIQVLKEEFIPLYKSIFDKLNPIHFDKELSKKQVAAQITTAILKQYPNPADLDKFVDDLVAVQGLVKNIVNEIRESEKGTKLSDTLRTSINAVYKTVKGKTEGGTDYEYDIFDHLETDYPTAFNTAIFQFNDMLNTILKKDVRNNIKKIARVEDALYKAQLMHRAMYAYTAQTITSNETLNRQLYSLTDADTPVRKVLDNVLALTKDTKDEVLKNVHNDIQTLINKTQGFYNYVAFYNELQAYRTEFNAAPEELKRVIINSLLDIITDSNNTPDAAAIKNLPDIIETLRDRATWITNTNDFLNNISVESLKKLEEYSKETITRDLKRMGIDNAKVTLKIDNVLQDLNSKNQNLTQETVRYYGLTNRNRYYFEINIADTPYYDVNTEQIVLNYLRDTFPNAKDIVSDGYKFGVVADEMFPTETGTVLDRQFNKYKYKKHYKGHTQIIDVNETTMPFLVNDVISDIEGSLERYIRKQEEFGLSLFSPFDKDSVNKAVEISENMDKLLKSLNKINRDSQTTIAKDLYDFLNIFKGNERVQKSFNIDDLETMLETKAGQKLKRAISKESMVYPTNDFIGLNAVLTKDAWNDIHLLNVDYESYGFITGDKLKINPYVAGALYDIGLKEIIFEDKEFSNMFTDEAIAYIEALFFKEHKKKIKLEPTTIYRLQQRWNNNKQRFLLAKQDPKNILANQAYFFLCSSDKPILKNILKDVSPENLMTAKWLFKDEPELSVLLNTYDQTIPSYRSQVLTYMKILDKHFRRASNKIDTNDLQNTLAYMYRDAEFAASMFPAVEEELFKILNNDDYTKANIYAIVKKLGGTDAEALNTYQMLNGVLASNGGLEFMKHDLFLYCLKTIKDPKELMAWYTTVVNNTDLYDTLRVKTSEKLSGDAAAKYIHKVSSTVLENEQSKQLLLYGAYDEAIGLAKMDLDNIFSAKTPTQDTLDKIAPWMKEGNPDKYKHTESIIQKVRESKTVRDCIAAGKASYDILRDVDKTLKGFKRRDLARMESTINDLQLQTLLSLDTTTLGDFIRDNYGLIHIDTDGIKLPWTKKQLADVNLGIKQIGNEYIIYNTDANYIFNKRISTKQFADIKVNSYRDTLDKLNPLKDKLSIYTNAEHNPFGDDLFMARTFTQADANTILDKFGEIQDMYLNELYFNNRYSRMDNVRFLSSSKLAKSQPYGLDYEKTLMINYFDLIKNNNMKTKYIDNLFRQEVFSPQIYAELLEDVTSDKEIAAFFKENHLTGVVISASTKGDAVYPRADIIKIRTRRDLQTLIKHPDIAAIVPKELSGNILTAINDHAADGRIIEILRLINYTWKVGIIAKPGQIIRNKLDALYKNLNESDSINIIEENRKLKVAATLNDLYNEIYEKSTELFGDVTYNKLDIVLDSIIESYELTVDEATTLKSLIKMVDQLNKYGVLDSDVHVLKEIQREFNERYLTGFNKRSRDYIEFIQNIPGIKQTLDANSTIERNARIALALTEAGKHKKIEAIIEKINDVHFNYAEKSPALQKAELFIPFNVFPIKNLAYWLNGGFKVNTLFRLMTIAIRESWADDTGSYGAFFYTDKNGNMAIDPYAVNAATSGSIRMGDHIIKTGWSFLDAMNILYDPINEAQSRLNPAIQYALSGGKDLYSGFSTIPFVGPEMYRIYKGQGINRALTGSMFARDYTYQTLQKNRTNKYYKYPKINRNTIRYGKYPKVSYKAMHGSNRYVAFKRYYGKVKVPKNMYLSLYPKNKYAIVNLRKWQSQNPSYYWSNAKNIVSNVKRIKAMFR